MCVYVCVYLRGTTEEICSDCFQMWKQKGKNTKLIN